MEEPITGEIHASQKQQNRSQVSATSERLTRILYIPCHSDTTSHLTLYHVSSDWIEATSDAPREEYNVNFTTGDKDKVVGKLEYHVQPESTVTELAQVEMTIGKTDEEVCSIKVNGDSGSAQPIDSVAVGISYPIPPSESQYGTIKLPYFHFRMPFQSMMTQFHWEVNPAEIEPLQYTLVRRPVEETEITAEIHAIYHHGSTRLSHSEGILLLLPCTNQKFEAMIVASVLGMLWRLRSLDGERRNKKALKMIKKNLFGSP